MSRRDVVSYGSLLLLLAFFVAFAWATRHPDDAVLRRAEGWPVVGPLVERLRDAYRRPPVSSGPPPPPASWAPAEERVEEAPVRRRPPELVPPPAPREVFYARPGDRLLVSPADGARPVTEVSSYLRAPILEERDGWVRVRADEVSGWIRRRPIAKGEPPFGRDPEPPHPIPGRTADPQHLQAARALLGPELAYGRLGPYPLVSDVADRALLAALDRVAGGMDEAWRRRYGLALVGEPAGSVVVFAREEDYRAYQREDERLRTLPAAGHSGYGIAALYVGDRTPSEVSATLAHEITHLLNRRGLGPALPPWLDEGIADDLGWCRTGADGTLLLGSLGGERSVDGERIELSGPRGSVAAFGRARAAGHLLRLRDLVALDWEGFVRSGLRETNYAESTLFVRFLLDGAGGSLAPGFRRFLAGTAAGEPVDGERLIRELGRSWVEIEALFAPWSEAEVAKAYRPEPERAAGVGTPPPRSGSSSRQAAVPPS